MGLKKRLFTMAVIACAAAAVAVVGLSGKTISQEQEESIFTRGKETIYFWYTDEALTDYLGSAAVAYGEAHDVRVIPVLASGLEYLEEINKASIQSENMPDLYIISNDSLEKAFLAGLASPISEESWGEIKEEYPDAARLAVTYKNKTIGYPFYFETSSLLYNRTYLEEFARSQIEAERDAAEGEAAMADFEENGPEEEGQGNEDAQAGESSQEGGNTQGDGTSQADADAQNEGGLREGGEGSGEDGTEPDGEMEALVDERVKELLPSTIDDILNFANEYNAPEQVEAIFKWDVTDIFYNYFFAGNYMIVGGAAGDNTENMNIYNKDAIDCLKVYQALNQFFSIDTKEISYEKVLNDFMEGKIVYTVATTDAVAKLEEAKGNGDFAYEYSIAPVPDINEELLTRSLSVTNCVAVNGYSDKQELARDFARFLTCEYTDTLYSRTGKVAARYGVDYGNINLQEFVNEYEVSVPMPKMVETSNFWVELEIAFAQIWDGADANDRLRQLSEQIMTQVTGEPYTETVIEEEEEIVDEVEYLDEEELRREAQEETEE
ncbi:MAG: sugar ABC transporter substrate-binding protein [Lachnospiraceae bacterium]|jgi:arabinogalactan oligomer/maltooligosaccharide transport system substrate-binding protein|nr:sugar ABC transporter substrate-binding protein [Lachnospiraceae bacterium]